MQLQTQWQKAETKQHERLIEVMMVMFLHGQNKKENSKLSLLVHNWLKKVVSLNAHVRHEGWPNLAETFEASLIGDW